MGQTFDEKSNDRIERVVRKVESQFPPNKNNRRSRRHRPEPPWLGKVTGIALQTDHQARWNYSITEQERLADGTIQNKPGGRTIIAINMVELDHVAEPAAGVAWYVWGVDAHGVNSDYPDGFGPRPVGGGGDSGTLKTNPFVDVTTKFNVDDGTPYYTIDCMGSHDGTCT